MRDHQTIVIVDFGSQVTQLIARRVREAGVYSEIHPYNQLDRAKIEAFGPKGIILSGGPASVTEVTSPRVGARPDAGLRGPPRIPARNWPGRTRVSPADHLTRMGIQAYRPAARAAADRPPAFRHRAGLSA